MSSLSRAIRRRRAKKNGIVLEGKPQPTVMMSNGGYITLHPTKGWMKVSGKRVKYEGTQK